MSMQVPVYRLQWLQCLSQHNVPVLTARAFDRAAASYALCADEYALFLQECFEAWKQDSTAPTLQLLRRAGQPLSQELAHNLHSNDPKQVEGVEGVEGVVSKTAQQEVQHHPNMNQTILQERIKARLLARDPNTLCRRCRSTLHACVSDNPQTRGADEGGSAKRKCANPDCGANANASNEKV
jgi:hypothetical protein